MGVFAVKYNVNMYDNCKNLENHPFLLGRHGQSVLNADEKRQGKAQGRGDIPWNGLTDKGREQARGIYHTLDAAGLTIMRVNSSRLLRAQETALVFVDSHPHPKPLLEEVCIHGLEEVSQAGWEMEYNREELMNLRESSLIKETERLVAEGLSSDLRGYVAWVAILGTDGESPLVAALRGIRALERYGVRPGELIISHAMLNRYIDAVATRIGSVDRSHLFEMLNAASNPLEKIDIDMLKTLKSMGLPSYNADDNGNKIVNGGVTEYTINAAGLWIAGRRIEPLKFSETTTFVESRRDKDGVWTRTR